MPASTSCRMTYERELQDYLRARPRELGAQTPPTYRLIVRRMREVQNTMYHELPQIRRRVGHNPALLHPLELAALGLRDGDEITLVSAHGQIRTIVGADDSLRRDVVSLTHGWGGCRTIRARKRPALAAIS